MKWIRTDLDNTVVGHPMDTLERIQYLNYYGLPYSASAEAKTSIIIWKKYEPDSEVLNYIDSENLSGRPWFDVPLYNNWTLV
jgi:hypothetical protein